MSDARMVIAGRLAGSGRTFDLSALPEGACLLSAEIAEPDGTLTVLYRMPKTPDEFADAEECCVGCDDLKADADECGTFHYCGKSQECPTFLEHVEKERASVGDD